MSTPRDNTEKARDLADGLRQLAAFIEARPDLYDELLGVANTRLCYLTGSPEVRGHMLEIARAAIAAGATASERINDTKWAYLDLSFGPVKVQIYTDRSWLVSKMPPIEVHPYPPLLAEIEPAATCGMTCCTAAGCREPGMHVCTQLAEHDGWHFSSHLTWPAYDGEVPRCLSS